MARVSPRLSPLLKGCQQNREHWMSEAEHKEAQQKRSLEKLAGETHSRAGETIHAIMIDKYEIIERKAAPWYIQPGVMIKAMNPEEVQKFNANFKVGEFVIVELDRGAQGGQIVDINGIDTTAVVSISGEEMNINKKGILRETLEFFKQRNQYKDRGFVMTPPSIRK